MIGQRYCDVYMLLAVYLSFVQKLSAVGDRSKWQEVKTDFSC